MKYVMNQIRQALVEHAKEADFSAQRGLIDELFPAIFQASKRMSIRAISRWLRDEQKIELSPMTISRALRKADEHWLAWVEEVEPAARIVGQAHDLQWEDVLFQPGLIESLNGKPPSLRGDNVEAQFADYDRAFQILRDRWLILDEDTRQECRSVACREELKEEKGQKNETGKK